MTKTVTPVRIPREHDMLRGKVTYDLGNGQWIDLDVRDVKEYGIEQLSKQHGFEVSAERLPVFRRGRKIGTVPANFEPWAIKSRSFLYDPRPGDFTRIAAGWEASNSLGCGDLDAIPGFILDGESDHHAHDRMVDEALDVLGALTGKNFPNA